MEQWEKVGIDPGDDVEVVFRVAGDIPLAEVYGAFGWVDSIYTRERSHFLPNGLGYSSRVLRWRTVFIVEGLGANATDGDVTVIFEEDVLQSEVFSVDFWLLTAKTEWNKDVAVGPHSFGKVL
jgi:hypothetical protein